MSLGPSRRSRLGHADENTAEHMDALGVARGADVLEVFL